MREGGREENEEMRIVEGGRERREGDHIGMPMPPPMPMAARASPPSDC